MFTYYGVFIRTVSGKVITGDFATIADLVDFVKSHNDIDKVIVDKCNMHINERDHKMVKECEYIATTIAEIERLV